jgi:rubredoxin
MYLHFQDYPDDLYCPDCHTGGVGSNSILGGSNEKR